MKAVAIKRAKEAASYYESMYHGCGQCVLAGIQEALEIPAPKVFKAATGFAGGIGAMGGTCGALMGGVLGSGLVVGRE